MSKVAKKMNESTQSEQSLGRPVQGAGPLYLAIDAGGTKTDYLLADEHQEVARVRGGCIKRMRVDAETADANLDAALQQLRVQARRPLSEVRHTCVGTAGETVPLVVDWLRAALPARISGQLTIVGDVEIALDAAFQGRPGVLVLAGTGSNVAGRRNDGSLVGAGGWGPQLADQGSANRIGLNGLRAGFLAKDEGRATSLLTEAMRFWGLGSEHELIAFANSIPAPDFSKLSKLVHGCALAGDPVAQQVLQREGQKLGYLVRLVIRRILTEGREENSAGLPPMWPSIAFAGSVMENVGAVRDALLRGVHQEFPDVCGLEGIVDPVQGALWRARMGAPAREVTRNAK